MGFFTLDNVTSLIAILVGIIIIIGTIIINIHRRKQSIIDEKISEKKLEIMEKEFENRSNILIETKKITKDISDTISQELINDPTWLDNFMDQTGVTYRASVYGKRIGHFFYEKKLIAENAVQKLLDYIKEPNNKTQYCLLIDSGTTLYPVFQELTKKIQENKSLWRKKVCIVTNNIPGIQYLMKHCKDDPNNDYSEIVIDCFLIPGKPLSVYSAITGAESDAWLNKLKLFLDKWENRDKKSDIKILGFITGNYFTLQEKNNEKLFYPVARGEGHVEIKRVMAEISDEIFLLSPLMKFSFVNVQQLNKVHNYIIERKNHDEAKKNPKEVKYEEIEIKKSKCRFFTTKRCKGNEFYNFGYNLTYDLKKTYKKSHVSIPDFDIVKFIPNFESNEHLEVEREIPHSNLREKYEKKINIWDKQWILDNL